jgi:hypothetical protein
LLSHLPNFLSPNVRRLEFPYSIAPDAVQSFHQLLESRAFKDITQLTLDGCRRLDIQIVLTALPSLEFLSVNECGMEVAEILAAVDRQFLLPQPLPLTTLSMAGNLGGQPLAYSFTIPPSIQSIKADRMQWSYDGFVRFWAAAVGWRSRAPFNVSLSNVGLLADGWERFHSVLDPSGCAMMGGLNWSGNPVSWTFFDFLTAAPRLRWLDVSGSLTDDDPALSAFNRFLKSSPSLTELIFSGSADRRLSIRDLRIVLEGIKESESLTSVTLCDHAAGPDLLVYLADVLRANHRIVAIKIGGNDIYDFSKFHVFLSKLQNRGTPLEMYWPDDELLHANPSQRDKMPLLRELFEFVRRGSSPAGWVDPIPLGPVRIASSASVPQQPPPEQKGDPDDSSPL